VALAFRRVLLYGGFNEETRVYHCAWRCSGERRLACRPTRAAKGEDVTGGIHTYGDETITWTSTGTGGALGSALLANAAAAITVHSGAQISGANVKLEALSIDNSRFGLSCKAQRSRRDFEAWRSA
jgi:hypothetical protein